MKVAYNDLVSQKKTPAIVCKIGDFTKASKPPTANDIESHLNANCSFAAFQAQVSTKPVKDIGEFRNKCSCEVVNVRKTNLGYNPEIDVESARRRK